MTTKDLEELYIKAREYTLAVKDFDPETIEIESDGGIYVCREDYLGGGDSDRQVFSFRVEALSQELLPLAEERSRREEEQRRAAILKRLDQEKFQRKVDKQLRLVKYLELQKEFGDIKEDA